MYQFYKHRLRSSWPFRTVRCLFEITTKVFQITHADVYDWTCIKHNNWQQKWYQGGCVPLLCCSWKPYLLLRRVDSWPTVWIRMECIFLWQFNHPIQVLRSLVLSVQSALFQADLFWDCVLTLLLETQWHRLPVWGRRQAHAIELLSCQYLPCFCSKRLCRQHKQYR